MTLYEQRLETDLTDIRGRVARTAGRVEAAVRDAVKGLLSSDHPLCYRLILGDLAINREIRDCDRMCHAFVARHLPAAGHLRFVSSVLRLNVALERVGDYAVTICREAVQLQQSPPEAVARDIRIIAEQAGQTLHRALDAFIRGDLELAREVMQAGSKFDRVYYHIHRGLLEARDSRAIGDLFALDVVLANLGRVSDQAKNVCEEVLFTVAGETKPAKRYRVLFLDADNAGLSALAEAIAQRSFPGSGHYESAGWAPAAESRPDLVAAAEAFGLELAPPRALETSHERLSRHHVIVSLAGDPRARFDEMPFRTVLQVWDIESLPRGADPEASQAAFEDRYRDLSARIAELMEALRGEAPP